MRTNGSGRTREACRVAGEQLTTLSPGPCHTCGPGRRRAKGSAAMPTRHSCIVPIVAVLAMALVACGSDDSDASITSPSAIADDAAQVNDTLTVAGTITYLQRIALEPGSTATVVLEDISRADAAATVVAEQVIDIDDEQVPIPFELVADRSELDDRSSYSVRAAITGPDGQLRWTTDTVNPIDPAESFVKTGGLIMVQVDPTTG
jgi:putative lipoprotein